MSEITRREFLHHSALAAGTTALGPALHAATSDRSTGAGEFRIAPFRFDVTPPKGHSLCGGWIKPVSDYDDSLEAIGFTLLGAGAPIVVCVVDWTGILNNAHVAWRTALATAAGTTPDRVAVQCVHQHNAPLVCFDAEEKASRQRDLPPIFDRAFHQRCLESGQAALKAGLKKARAVTQIAQGTARIEQVASNRRMARDAQGRVTKMRGSSTRDPELRALPEGPIDPFLKTVAFFDRGEKIAACHYYATHPMSYYGDGRVSSDFCGLARKRLQAEDANCTHLYFTGCAGNVTAGKYNDGSPAARVQLTERMYRGMKAAEADLQPVALRRVEWRTQEIQPPPNPALGLGALEELVGKPRDGVVFRLRPAFKLASIQRYERKIPFVLSALHLNDISLLHLPAEPFVEYQLQAQRLRPKGVVAVAAYGDGGPWYIPTRREFPSGGYEVEYAFWEPDAEDLLAGAIQRLLA